MDTSCYSFGPFVLDAGRHMLLKDNEAIVVPERVLATLIELVRQAGEVVEKRDLIESVWPDLAVVDDNLVQAIGDLRRALGDDPHEPRYIQTVHRRGYRFVAPVAVGAGPALPPAAPRTGVGRRWQRLALPLGAVLVIVAIALAALIWRRLAGERAQARAAVADEEVYQQFRQLVFEPAGAIKPAFSPDGKFLAVVAPEPGGKPYALFLVRPGRARPLQLTHGLEVRGPGPVFSTDGDTLFFTTYRHPPGRGTVPEVWQVPILGGPPRLVRRHASSASPSPDGSSIAFAAVTQQGTRIVVRARDGAETPIAPEGYWPRWSPDGRWIAYTTSNPEGGDGHLFVVTPSGEVRRRLTDSRSQLYGLCWTPDARWIVFASDRNGAFNLWRVPSEGGPIVAVTSGLGEISGPTISPDGGRLAFTYVILESVLRLVPDLRSPGEVVHRDRHLASAALAPSGGRVAFVARSSTRLPRLALLEAGAAAAPLASDLRAWRVRWEASEESLLVVAPAETAGPTQIWDLAADGEVARRLTPGEATWDWPDASPDGRRLAAARRRGVLWELVVLDLDSGRERVLAVAPAIEGIRWSPDGQWLAWSGPIRPADTRSAGLWVVAAGGGPPRRVAADGAWPVWEVDGTALLFARALEVAGLWRVPLAGGEPVLVRPPEGYVLKGWDAGPGGAPALFHLERGTNAIHTLEGLQFQ